MPESNARRRKRQAEWKAAGLCTACGGNLPEDGKGFKCAACRERNDRSHAKQYKQRTDDGLCTYCGRVPAKPGRKQCERCLAARCQQDKKRRKQKKDKGLCSCGRVPKPGRTRCAQCSTRYHRHYQKLRDQVFAAYGGYKCACCGETQPKFLQIDHVDNDGAEHRRETGGSIYSWLKKNGFPQKGFQVLCANCNSAKGYYGRCPHQDDS